MHKAGNSEFRATIGEIKLGKKAVWKVGRTIYKRFNCFYSKLKTIKRLKSWRLVLYKNHSYTSIVEEL